MTTKTKATKPAKQLVLIVGEAAIGKGIDAIIKTGKKLDRDIQIIGLSLLAHIDEHSNPTMLNRLVAEFPAGLRRNAFAEWVLAHGKVKLNEGDDKKVKPFLLDKTRKTNMDGAHAKMWTEFKPEQDLDKVFDFGAMLMSLLNKAGKAKNLEGKELMEKVRMLAVCE